MEIKPASKSRTLWFNALGGILAPWTAYLSGAVPLAAAVSATAVSVVNLGLRLITKQPISLTGQ